MTLTTAGGGESAPGFVMKGDGPVRVRMKHQMSGTRQGVDWPAPGEEIALPEDEAVTLLNSGMAEPVEDRDEPETATAPKPTTRARAKKS